MIIKSGMGSHQSHKMLKDEWLTPPYIIKALGPFDLDPCAPIDRPWPTAEEHWTIEHDGLTCGWFGRVWCNPPYGKETGKWLKKMVEHNNGIVLIFARTETKNFFDYIWPHAIAILFIKGRLYFYHVNGKKAKTNSGAPSVLIAYGINNAEILKNSGIEGKFLYLNNFM
jgi:hypothetical protein